MKKPPTKRQLNSLTIDELRELRGEIQQLINEKREAEPRRPRGRPGTKMLQACQAVPEKPQLAVEFCQENGISTSTLRQLQRVDPIIEPPIQVRIVGGNLYVWRGDPDPLKQSK